MKYYLILYDRKAGQIVGAPKEFSEESQADALQERFLREREAVPGVEVMLLAAESLAVLKTTHARYFFDLDHLASPKDERSRE